MGRAPDQDGPVQQRRGHLRRRRRRSWLALGAALVVAASLTVLASAGPTHAEGALPCGGPFTNVVDGDITSYFIVDCAGDLPPTTSNPECPTATLTFSAVATPAAVAPGALTTLTLGGFGPGSEVVVTLCGSGVSAVLGTFQAGADGGVGATVAIPGTTPCGVYNLAVTGRRADDISQVFYATVNVTCHPRLPITGSDSGQLAGLGAVLVALGGAAVLGGRRNRGRPDPVLGSVEAPRS